MVQTLDSRSHGGDFSVAQPSFARLKSAAEEGSRC